MTMHLTPLDDVTCALRASSLKLHKAAGTRGYSALFQESSRGKAIYERHQPEQPFEGKVSMVRLVSNRVTGRARTEWSHDLGIEKVSRFPQHVVSGEDLKFILRTSAPFGDLRHTLLPKAGKGVKEIFSVEVEAPQKRMDEFLSSLKGRTRADSVIRSKTRNAWVFVTGNEELLKKFVVKYAQKFGKPRNP